MTAPSEGNRKPQPDHEPQEIQGKLAWQFHLEPKEPSRIPPFIYSFSASQDTVAVVDPQGGTSIRLLDSSTGKEKAKILDGFVTNSVSFLDGTILLATHGRKIGAPGRIGATITKFDEKHKLTSDLPWIKPPYVRLFGESYLGNPLILPDKKQALLAGASDDPITGGFIAIADWSYGTDRAVMSVLADQIDEAPYDFARREDQVFIPTGRDGNILIFDLKTYKVIGKLPVPQKAPYKPSSITVTDQFTVASSYNELFWFENDQIVKQEKAGSDQDVINSLVTLADGKTVVYTLTFSDQIILKSGPDQKTQKIVLPNRLQEPCILQLDPERPNRLYVSGRSNSTVTAIDLPL